MEGIVTLVSSVGVSALLTAGLVFLAKTWISERMKRAIEHEYAEKLETHKAKLEAANAVAIEKLRGDLVLVQSGQAGAMASVTAGQIAAHERKLKAVEDLWSFILAMKESIPGSVSFASDLLTDAEYDDLSRKESPLAQDLRKLGTTYSLEHGEKSKSVERSRPFLGELLYGRFWVHRAILGRIIFLVTDGMQRGKMVRWWEDTGVRELLELVLDVEERDKVLKAPFGRLKLAMDTMERRILEAASKVVSGEQIGDEAFGQARKMMGQALQVEEELGRLRQASTP